ncbi:MAG: sporulation protein YqfD [Ruminococcus sp.]|nr:sporulation protein YqfD [Ruminococcus sp.]
MLNKIVRFVLGYVDFTAEGRFPERFLNLTSRSGVNLFNTVPSSKGLSASMSLSDYFTIRKIARKSRVRLKVVGRHGMPFIVNKYSNRIGIPVGGFLGIILIMILSNFIWSVQITGIDTVSNTYIRNLLNDYGISVGAYKNNIDVKSVERNIQLNVNEIGWMSINLTGNIASVELKAKAIKPEIKDTVTPSNLKAKCDGVITKINVRRGVTAVTKGSGVTKGDLLVSGIAESSKENVDTIRYLRASGEIFADVMSEKKFSIPSSYEYCHIMDNYAVRNNLKVLWLSFPTKMSFDFYEGFARQYRTENLTINETVLPISITTQTDFETGISKAEPDMESAGRIFENQAALYEIFECGEKSVVSRDMHIMQAENGYNCVIDYVFNENIAENVDFIVTE